MRNNQPEEDRQSSNDGSLLDLDQVCYNNSAIMSGDNTSRGVLMSPDFLRQVITKMIVSLSFRQGVVIRI